jgi:hypothetical protein
MKHVIFIVTMLVAGVAAGVWFMHVREQMREAAIAATDAAVVRPPIEVAVVPPAAPIEDIPPPRPPPIDAAVAQALSDDCDEVSCVLDDYARPCCDQYRHALPPADGAPLDLDRAMIVDGVKSVKARIAACASPTVHGKVKARVRVAPSGAVSSVTILETPDPKLGSCVHDIMASILFKPTQNGGVFSYPFVF